MSPTGQFICFLIAFICIAIAGVMRLAARAWDSALVAAGLCAYILVFVVNAADAM